MSFSMQKTGQRHVLMQKCLQHYSSPGPHHLWLSSWEENAAWSGIPFPSFLPASRVTRLLGCGLITHLPQAAHRWADGTSQPPWHQAHAGSVKPVFGARSDLLFGKVMDGQVSSYRPAFSENSGQLQWSQFLKIFLLFFCELY